jgi:formylglycine-generating enzyme required for sulfatase activity
MPRFINMKRVLSYLVITLWFGIPLAAQVTFTWATVGDPDNPDNERGYGKVSYIFRMAETEVTTRQYADFLNAVAASDPHQLWGGTITRIGRSGSSGSYTYSVNAGFEDHPVVGVSYESAMRFVNWLENGQGSGDTETGTYTLGAEPRESRNPNATYFLPSYDEWVKAAFYDPRTEAEGGPGTQAHYWTYATASDVLPAATIPVDGTNTVTFSASGTTGVSAADTTPVGTYINTKSYYGIFDMNGNAAEYTETPFGSKRILPGGGWRSNRFSLPVFSSALDSTTNRFRNDYGFRVAAKATQP